MHNAKCDSGDMGCALCREGLTGVYCQLCVDPAHYYVPTADSNSATCQPCEDSLGQTIGYFVLGAGTLVTVLLLGTGLWRKAFAQWQKDRLHRILQAAKALLSGNQIKVVIGFYMIATKIDSVYEVGLPADVGRFLKLDCGCPDLCSRAGPRGGSARVRRAQRTRCTVGLLDNCAAHYGLCDRSWCRCLDACHQQRGAA